MSMHEDNEHFYHFLFLFCSSHFWNSPSPFSSPLLKLAPSTNSVCPHFPGRSWSFATIPLSNPLRLFIPLTFQSTYKAFPSTLRSPQKPCQIPSLSDPLQLLSQMNNVSSWLVTKINHEIGQKVVLTPVTRKSDIMDVMWKCN